VTVEALDIGGDLGHEFAILGPTLMQRVSPFGPLVLFTQAGEVLLTEADELLEAEEA
jgi:hypothetical protein